MKRLLLLVVLTLSISVFAQEDWTYLTRDQKINRYHLNAKGELRVDGQVVQGFMLQKTADRIGISPPSSNGKYAVILSFGDEGSQLSFLEVDQRRSRDLGVQGTPVVWSSWSPDGSFVLLSTYSETDTSLYVIPIATLQPKKVPIQLHQQGERTELATTTINWTAPDTFQMEATIHCASSSPGCDSRAEEKVLRMYNVTVNAGSLQVTPEELPVAEEQM